jgi:hypothetical protein
MNLRHRLKRLETPGTQQGQDETAHIHYYDRESEGSTISTCPKCERAQVFGLRSPKVIVYLPAPAPLNGWS